MIFAAENYSAGPMPIVGKQHRPGLRVCERSTLNFTSVGLVKPSPLNRILRNESRVEKL